MIKQNPFSLYDFFGYFIPGAIMCYLLVFLTNDISNLNDYLNVVNKDEFQFDKLLFFVIVSYSLGHLISYLSSISVEKYSIWKYDYPSKYLLGLNEEQKYLSKSMTWKLKLIKTILWITLLPISIYDLILGEYFNFKVFYTKKLDEFLIKVIGDKSLKLIDTLYPPVYHGLRHYDFHRIISHYVYENSKNHQSKLTNYVALYGFLRAIALISTCTFWIVIYKSIHKSYILYTIYGFKPLQLDYEKILFLITIAGITYIYFMGFMKFYRRYTLEAYMLVAIDKEILVAKNHD